MLSDRSYMKAGRRRGGFLLTEILIAACVAIFLAQSVSARLGRDWFDALALCSKALTQGQIWRFITYIFLHSTDSIFHIVINMLVLWWFGRPFEAMVGSRTFARIFFLAGIAGGVLWTAFHLGDPYYVVGASAGVSGLVAAYATLFPDRPIGLVGLPFVFKAKHFVIGIAAIELYIVLLGDGGPVAHLAHLGGMAAAFLYVRYLLPRLPGPRGPGRWDQLFRGGSRGGPGGGSWTGGGPHLTVVPRSGDPAQVRKPRGAPRTDDPVGGDFVRSKVDPILDKISREGMGSLTRDERRILEEARDRMRRGR